jgi:signal peptidase
LILATLRKLWKNEYFQTIITILLLLTSVFVFWYITQTVLRTEYPALAVASGSMLPTLNVGDLIIVQGVPPEEIVADPLTGDIIVFKNRNDLIVHRAIDKKHQNENYYFTTHGDNNPLGVNEGPIHENNVIGKVIGRIPYIGNLALFMHSRENIYLFAVIIIVLIAIIILFPFGEKEKVESEKKEGILKFLEHPDLKLIYHILANVLLLGLLFFSLWGEVTFWNPGAGSSNQGMYVTLYGLYPDVQFHSSFKNSQKISEVFLTHSLLTYRIDCQLSEGLRTGVPTFSWFQATIFILVVLNLWKLTKFLRKNKKVEEKSSNRSTPA